MLTQQGLDLYRQDFNIDQLAFWRAADAEDRQGMAENLDVQGYLAYWDELKRRHPDMLIVTCASGGQRMAFRRAASPFLAVRFRLRGLDASAAYRVTHGGAESEQAPTDEELLHRGLRTDEAPEAAVIAYEKRWPTREEGAVGT